MCDFANTGDGQHKAVPPLCLKDKAGNTRTTNDYHSVGKGFPEINPKIPININGSGRITSSPYYYDEEESYQSRSG